MTVPGKGGAPKIYTDEFLENEAKELVEWFENDETHYWLKDFAIMKGYPAEYFDRWAKRNETFEQALKTAHNIQERRLFNLGLAKPNVQSLVIFALKNVAGWRDRQELDQKITGKYTVTNKDNVKKAHNRLFSLLPVDKPVDNSDEQGLNSQV